MQRLFAHPRHACHVPQRVPAGCPSRARRSRCPAEAAAAPALDSDRFSAGSNIHPDHSCLSHRVPFSASCYTYTAYPLTDSPSGGLLQPHHAALHRGDRAGALRAGCHRPARRPELPVRRGQGHPPGGRPGGGHLERHDERYPAAHRLRAHLRAGGGAGQCRRRSRGRAST